MAPLLQRGSLLPFYSDTIFIINVSINWLHTLRRTGRNCKRPCGEDGQRQRTLRMQKTGIHCPLLGRSWEQQPLRRHSSTSAGWRISTPLQRERFRRKLLKICSPMQLPVFPAWTSPDSSARWPSDALRMVSFPSVTRTGMILTH